MPAEALSPAREALERHDWLAAYEAATASTFSERAVEAERADIAADAAWWLGRLEVCTAERERAYQVFDELGESRRAGQCAVWLFEHHMFRARPAIAGAWLRRARRALNGDEDCVEYGALVLREADSAHGSGELDRALALASDAIDLGRRLGSAELEAQALQTKGRVVIDQGDIADGMAYLDEAMLFAIEGRLSAYATGKVYCSLISACEELGDVDRAAEWTEATMRWAEQHPFAIFPGICRVHRAVVLKRRGDLAGAEREAVRACEELIDSHLGNSAAAYAEVGDIRRRLGHLDEAETAFAKAQELCGSPCGGLGLLRLAQGKVSAAMSIVSGCLRGSANAMQRAALLPALTQVAIAAGDLDAAAAAATELENIADAFDTAFMRANALVSRGRVELAGADASRACATLDRAVAAWQALEIPYEVATARTLLAQALRETGEDAAAKECFAAATRLFDQIGASLDAGSLTSARALPAGLTEREVEVLRLIATGLTNNDIAASLYLSVKTVSRHISNIFTKIGVNSRAAATAFAFEHELVS